MPWIQFAEGFIGATEISESSTFSITPTFPALRAHQNEHRHLPHVPTAEQFLHLPSFQPYYHFGEICPFGPKPPAGATVRHHAVSHPHLMGCTGGDVHENKQKNNKSGVGVRGHTGKQRLKRVCNVFNSIWRLLHIARLWLCLAGPSVSAPGVSREHLQVTLRFPCPCLGMTKQDMLSRIPPVTGENESPFHF